MQYVGSAKIDDWRYRSEDDKILSLFFKTTLVYGQITANDDLAELEWFDVTSLNQMMAKELIVPEHHVLVHLLIKYLQQS